jgi:hypothetical protein
MRDQFTHGRVIQPSVALARAPHARGSLSGQTPGCNLRRKWMQNAQIQSHGIAQHILRRAMLFLGRRLKPGDQRGRNGKIRKVPGLTSHALLLAQWTDVCEQSTCHEEHHQTPTPRRRRTRQWVAATSVFVHSPSILNAEAAKRRKGQPVQAPTIDNPTNLCRSPIRLGGPQRPSGCLRVKVEERPATHSAATHPGPNAPRTLAQPTAPR